MKRYALRRFLIRLLTLGLAAAVLAALALSVSGYKVIEEMEQVINGKTVTVKGRIRWPQNVTIHVYIPNDPEGKGAQQEVQAACKAWEEKLRSETNANLSFTYHAGQSAPPMGPNDPPPYVIEVNWTDEETTGEPGSATPVSNVTQTGPDSYQRGDTFRGIININRNQSPNQPYNGNAIYNIALHEFGHIFGLDHKTPDQDSVVMDDRGIDDPNKKIPIKDDDVRGLQDINGRNTNSRVPPKEEEAEDEDEQPADASGIYCCAFECGGAFGCVMVNSQAECDAYDGAIQPGTCESTGQEEQDQGVYGRCNGSLHPLGPCCGSSLGTSHYVASPGSPVPGGHVSFVLSVRNDGSGPTWFSVHVEESPWLEETVIEASTGFAPGSEPFDPPPAVTHGCIPPEGEITIIYRARVSEELPDGEPVTSMILLDDVLRRESYVLAASYEAADGRFASMIPEDVRDCARILAWASGYRHITHREERWSVRENSPRETCVPCGSPMCVVCMEYDLGTYETRPGVTGSQRSCMRTLERYLRTATRQETEALAALYWISYWDGRHNRNRP